MQSEKGWRRDAPTSTLAPREGEEMDAGRQERAEIEAAVHDFATAASTSTDLVVLCDALATAARRVAGGAPIAVHLAGETVEPASGATALPLRVGESGKTWGWLVLDGPGAALEPPSEIMGRRLESLATLAAFAIERHRSRRPASPPARPGPNVAPSVLHDVGLLGTVLPFALSQARRHKEPLSILIVAIGRLRGVRDLLGESEADRVVSRIGIGIVGLLRSSDLVARLDGDRLMVVLPRSELHDARRVGEKLCQGIAAAHDLMGIPLKASLSIGAATFPTSASTLGELFDAADAALAEACELGPGRVAAAFDRGREVALRC